MTLPEKVSVCVCVRVRVEENVFVESQMRQTVMYKEVVQQTPTSFLLSSSYLLCNGFCEGEEGH